MENHDLAAMLQRFNAGDRSLDVLAPLNEAAWDCFHDPWEAKPFFLTENAEAFLGGGLPRPVDLPPAEELPPSRRPAGPAPRLADLVTAYLEVRHWEYAQDETGGFNCVPALRGMDGLDLTLRLCLEGTRSGELGYSLSSAWQVPERARQEASDLCGHWNASLRELRARLQMPPAVPGHARTGTLVLQNSLSLRPKPPMKTIVAFLDGCLNDAREFWQTARTGLRR